MNPTLVKPGLFRDRRDAGRVLAEKLAAYANRPDVIVLALPRGGVPVAHEVARRLVAPMDVFVVRKLGVPGYEEFLEATRDATHPRYHELLDWVAGEFDPRSVRS